MVAGLTSIVIHQIDSLGRPVEEDQLEHRVPIPFVQNLETNSPEGSDTHSIGELSNWSCKQCWQEASSSLGQKRLLATRGKCSRED